MPGSHVAKCPILIYGDEAGFAELNASWEFMLHG
jgi:hypothetical protein